MMSGYENKTIPRVDSRGGRMKGSRPGAGPGGYCICQGCGEMIRHKMGTPCYTIICPKCRTKMTRPYRGLYLLPQIPN